MADTLVNVVQQSVQKMVQLYHKWVPFSAQA